MSSEATKAWLAKAQEDEEVVQIIVANRGPWSQAAYHIQQAAEKHIKAALVEAGIAPKKEHDLPMLLADFPSQVDSDLLEAAANISSFAILTRYPGGPEFRDEDVNKAVARLAIVKEWAARHT